MKDVVLKSGEHGKEVELPQMKDTSEWQRTSNKEHKCSWSFRVDLEEAFKGFFVVLGEDINFRLKKCKWSITRHKDWKPIKFLCPERGSRVGSVLPSKSR